MAISDNPRRQAQRTKVRRNMGDVKATWWSDKQKLETVQSYLMLGNLAMTARVLKIPEETVRRWRQTSWWKEIEGELRVQDELQLSARMKKVMEHSLDAVEDRLSKGDYVYDQKTGQMRRKPVSMRDAHKVSMDLIEKRDILNKRNTVDSSEEQMSDKLLKMMKQFAEFAQGKLDTNNTIEAEDATIIEDEVVQDGCVSPEVRSIDGESSVGDILPDEEDNNAGHIYVDGGSLENR